MIELFKGYIALKGKKAIEKFKDRTDLRTYEEVQDLDSFAGVLSKDVIMIDVDNYEMSEALFNIIEANDLRCRVYETTRGKHFYFINDGVTKCKTKTQTPIGIEVDIKVGLKNSYDALKVDGKEREIIYDIFEDEEYQTLPAWLKPIDSNVELFGMDEGDGRNQTMFNYILTLQKEGLDRESIKTTCGIINDFVFKHPLPKHELETILRDESFASEDAFDADDTEDANDDSFFNSKGSFLFDKFAKFLVSKYNIIKIDNILYTYNNGIYINGNKEIESLMIKHISSLNKQKRNEVLAYLDILIDKNTLQADAKYIAFKNGIYNVETDELQDFSPSIVLANKINHNYNPSAFAEVVDKSLNNIACHDEQIRMLLEEVIGYNFLRKNELRKCFLLTGDKRNGKSTFLDIIQNVLGDENTCSLDLKELGDRFKTAEIYMRLANIGDDIGADFISNPAIFKKLVSGNRVNAERKGQDPFDFNSYAKLLFSANDIPRIKDKSGAVIDRLIIVPFNANFSKDDPDYDPYIKYKLIEEEALEYAIILGIRGLKRVIKNQGFTTSEKVQQELEEYEESNNPILLFFKEIDGTEILNETTNVVYQRYSEFCLSNSLQSLSQIEFSRQVKKHLGYNIVTKSVKGKKYRVFVQE